MDRPEKRPATDSGVERLKKLLPFNHDLTGTEFDRDLNIGIVLGHRFPGTDAIVVRTEDRDIADRRFGIDADHQVLGDDDPDLAEAVIDVQRDRLAVEIG